MIQRKLNYLNTEILSFQSYKHTLKIQFLFLIAMKRKQPYLNEYIS